MGVNGKAKGATAEREAAALLTGWAAEIGIALDLQRNLEQTRGGGHDLTGLETFGLAVEVKRVEALAINSWWAQAKRQAVAVDCSPVLMWRQNRQPWRFQVEEWIWPCPQKVVLTLQADQFKIWFHSVLRNKLQRATG